jgi:hypothetical protein
MAHFKVPADEVRSEELAFCSMVQAEECHHGSHVMSIETAYIFCFFREWITGYHGLLQGNLFSQFILPGLCYGPNEPIFAPGVLMRPR